VKPKARFDSKGVEVEIAPANKGQFRLGMTWREARIITKAMMATLGGDIAYPEYRTRVGADIEEVIKMIYDIQMARRRDTSSARPSSAA
jgi:hypothetical protein